MTTCGYALFYALGMGQAGYVFCDDASLEIDVRLTAMSTWHFYQGLKDEWRWYRLDDAGTVLGESDRGFAELRACMANAEAVGFRGSVFRVHTRASTDSNGSVGRAPSPRTAAEGSTGRSRRDDHTT